MMIEARGQCDLEPLHDGKARAVDNREILVWKALTDGPCQLEIVRRHNLKPRRAASNLPPKIICRVAPVATVQQQPGFGEHVVCNDMIMRAPKNGFRSGIVAIARTAAANQTELSTKMLNALCVFGKLRPRPAPRPVLRRYSFHTASSSILCLSRAMSVAGRLRQDRTPRKCAPYAWLPEIVREKPPDVLRKRDAELGGFRLRATLRVGVEGDLGAGVHDHAIMPSPGLEGNRSLLTPPPRSSSSSSRPHPAPAPA